MSIVKRALGFGGYGQSKPVISYHTQNSDSVTTVVTEISHMSLNENQTYAGAGAMQKKASLTELCSEDAEVQKHGYGQQQAYGSDVGGFDALVRDSNAQKHGYGEQKASYQHESGAAGGYGAHHHESAVQKHGAYGGQKASSYQHGGGYDAVSHDSAGAVQKHGYGEQKAYQHGAEAHHDSKHGYGEQKAYGGHHQQDSKVQKSGYGSEHTAYQHEGDLKGYTALHQDSKVQKHGYGGEQKAHDGAVQKHGYGGEQKAYAHGSAGAALHHDSYGAAKKHGYGGEHQAYQHGAEAGGYEYDAVHHGSSVQKHGYGEQKAYQHGSDAGGYGGVHHDSKHGYGGQKAYQHGAGAGGYDAAFQHGGAVVKKHGYGGQMGYQHGSDAGGYVDAFQHGGATQKHGYGGVNAYPPQGCGGGDVAGYDALVKLRQMQKQKQCYGGNAYTQTQYGQGCESDEESDEESDCEEEVLPHAGYGAGGYPAGSIKPGGTQYYSAYERHQQLGGGSRYEAYQSSTTQGYSGGYGGWAQPKSHSFY